METLTTILRHSEIVKGQVGRLERSLVSLAQNSPKHQGLAEDVVLAADALVENLDTLFALIRERLNGPNTMLIKTFGEAEHDWLREKFPAITSDTRVFMHGESDYFDVPVIQREPSSFAAVPKRYRINWVRSQVRDRTDFEADYVEEADTLVWRMHVERQVTGR